ncbi:hypothetical protein PG997_007174 [Apiospora hydei]|uniref:Alpha/beta-hydrolase n=1 Tax=Apiospora hydei TaxID=1337664 RepID=A0ABR1WA14_9PEZI
MIKSILAAVSLFACSSASPLALSDKSAGTGPYPASWFTESSLPNFTFYMPTAPTDSQLPVVLFGEGGCENNGTRFEPFLTEIASHGFLVVANGPPNGTGKTNSQYQRDASAWVSARAGKPGRYAAVDASRMAAAGQSCGGLETYLQRDNPYVSYLGIFNSGFLPGGNASSNLPDGTTSEDPSTISQVHKPTFYFLGGPTDIAYANGERDYHALTGVPKWIGNFNVGHSGTYRQPNGGVFGVAAVQWLQWVLQKNATASLFFTAGGAQAANWTEVESDGLGSL